MNRKYELLFLGCVLTICLLLIGCGGGGGSSSTNVQTLKISPNPDGGSKVFSGETITFTVSGGDTPYTWTSSDTSLLSYMSSMSAPNGETAVFLASGSGTTTVFVLDDKARRAEAQVTVTLKTPRVVPQEAAIEFTGRTNPASVSFRVSGGFSPYTWAVQDPTVALIDGDTTDIDEVQVLANGVGSSQIIVYDDYNSSASATLVVVGSALRCSPASAVIGLGDKITLNALGGGAPYYWEVEDNTLGDVSPDNGESVDFTASKTQTGTTYVILTDVTGVTARMPIEIVRTSPILIPTQASLRGGETLRLRADGGELPFTFLPPEPRDGGELVQETATTALFTASETIGSASVTITVEDADGVQGQAVINVANYSIMPSSVTLSAGDSFKFLIFGGVSPYTAQLSKQTLGAVTVSGNGATVTVSVTAPAGSYTLTIIDAIGSVRTAGIVIQ